MRHRSVIFVTTTMFLLVACSSNSAGGISPTETISPPATETSAPTLEPATPTLTLEPTPLAEWLDLLEVIQVGNWSRLQLLKTFPAEIPLNRSAVAISPDGKTMAVGSSGGAKIFFFDIESGQLSQTILMGISNVGAYFNINGMEYLPDGTLLVNSDGPYAIYHMDTAGNILSVWDGISFALTTDKKIMAHDGEGISLVDLTSNTRLLTLDDINALYFAFSPDGSKIAAEDIGVDFLYTAIWDISSKTVLTKLDDSSNPRFSPDGRFLAVTKYDYENNKTPVKIFSPDGATEITTLDVNDANGVSNLPAIWSLDGSIIVAQIANGSPVAWDTSNWQPLESRSLRGEIYAFSPDGRILITHAPDGGILLWGVLL